MWEEYPLWFTFFTKLGFRVLVSAESNEKLHLKSMDTIACDSECYPAKLTHGHVQDLIDRKVDVICFPTSLYSRKEVKQQAENYQCALLSTYSSMINNSFNFKSLGITLFNPSLPVYDDQVSAQRCAKYTKELWSDISEKEAQNAYLEGCKAY